MKLNFFDWIREGVKQSVLLGISDAASQIGSADEVEELNQKLIGSFKKNLSTGRGSGRSKRKALGRSLVQCMDEED